MDDAIPALKRQLHRELIRLVGHVNQSVSAGRLGISQPRMSNLLRGRLEGFSLEMLIRLLARLDRRVDLTVTNIGGPFIRFRMTPRRPGDIAAKDRAERDGPSSN